MGLMILRAGEFRHDDDLPEQFTAGGIGVSPELSWKNIPGGARYLILRVSSIDDNGRVKEHWLSYNIPSFILNVEEDSEPIAGMMGLNDGGSTKYSAPAASVNSVVNFELYATHEEITETDPLRWSEVQCLIANKLVGNVAKLSAHVRVTPAMSLKKATLIQLPGYTLTDLGAYDHYSYDPRIGQGQVYAGQDFGSGPKQVRAAVWNFQDSNQWMFLAEPGDNYYSSICLGGEDALLVGHYSWLEIGQTFACIWTPFSIYPLPMPTGANGSSANSINMQGAPQIITGEASRPGAGINNDAVIWEDESPVGSWAPTILPSPATTPQRADAVGYDNVTETVFGNILDDVGGSLTFRAVRWQKDNSGLWTFTHLDIPSGSPTNYSTTVHAFSDGYALGRSGPLAGPFSPVYWDVSGSVAEVNVSGDAQLTGHYGNLFCGVSWNANGPRAFAWTPTGGEIDIHPAGNVWSFANGVDELGNIVGVSGTQPYGSSSIGNRLFVLEAP